MAYRLEYRKNEGSWTQVPIGLASSTRATLVYVGGYNAGGTGASYNVSLSGTLTGGIASSPSEGDLIIVACGHGGTASSAPTCSGNTSGTYQNVHAALYSNDTWDTNFQTFYQFAGATPDTTLTIGRTNNTTYGGHTCVQVWRNVDTGTPIDVTAATNSASNQSASRPNPPSYTPTTTNAVIIAAGAGMQTTSGGAFTIPSGMTNGVSGKTDGTTSDCGTFMASFAWTSGAYDPAAVTGGTTSTSGSHASTTFALRPKLLDNDVYVATSSNITAGGENTTAQLTAPAGKSSGSDFDAGRIWDDENDSDTVTITADDYSELEWSIGFSSGSAGVYDFRVTDGGAALSSYAYLARIIVGGQTVSPEGLAVPVAFGTSELTTGSGVTLTLNGVAVPTAFGTTTVAPTVVLTLTGAAVPVAFGTTTVAPEVNVSLDGVAVPLAFGTSAVAQDVNLTLTGLAVPVDFGTSTVAPEWNVDLSGLAVPVAFGDTITAPEINLTLDGIAVPLAYGTAIVAPEWNLELSGLAVPTTFGTGEVTQGASPLTLELSGLPVPVDFGAAHVALDVDLTLTGIAVPVEFGTILVAPEVELVLTGVAIPTAFGTTEVTTGAAPVTLELAGLPVAVEFGTTLVAPEVNLTLTGLAVGVNFGTASVTQGSAPLTLELVGVAVPAAFGDSQVALDVNLGLSGLAVSVALGDTLTAPEINLFPDGLAVPVAAGTAIVAPLVTLEATGVAVPTAFGTGEIASTTSVVTLELVGVVVQTAFGATLVQGPPIAPVAEPIMGGGGGRSPRYWETDEVLVSLEDDEEALELAELFFLSCRPSQ